MQSTCQKNTLSKKSVHPLTNTQVFSINERQDGKSSHRSLSSNVYQIWSYAAISNIIVYHVSIFSSCVPQLDLTFNSSRLIEEFLKNEPVRLSHRQGLGPRSSAMNCIHDTSVWPLSGSVGRLHDTQGCSHVGFSKGNQTCVSLPSGCFSGGCDLR